MNKLFASALLFAMLAVSACSSMQLPTVEQEEEISQGMPTQGKYTVDPRWEVGNWDVDYGGGD
ncbi:MAG TPA: hypothetical protein VIB79_01765 [Candidatus Binatia bacterium]|jgi:hypothetical protein